MRRSLAAIFSIDHGNQVPTTGEGAAWTVLSLSSLNVAINALDLAARSTLPAFSSLRSEWGFWSALTDWRPMHTGLDGQRSGLHRTGGDVCEVRDQGLNRRRVDQLSRPVLGAIE